MTSAIKKKIVAGAVVLFLLWRTYRFTEAGDPEFLANNTIYAAVREAFGELTDDQAIGPNVIEQAWYKYVAQYGGALPARLSYIMATAWHESKFLPVEEKRALPGTSLYIEQNAYWNSGFYGRGYVQLTHEYNYKKMGDRIGIDLVNNPEKAMYPEIAAQILVIGMMEGLFTDQKLTTYITDYYTDFIGARKVVSSTESAGLIAGYAQDFFNYGEAHAWA